MDARRLVARHFVKLVHRPVGRAGVRDMPILKVIDRIRRYGRMSSADAPQTA
jgi:hypothetical protein